MRTIQYPSKEFQKECDAAIDRLEDFIVVVSSNSMKRAALLREEPSLTDYLAPKGGFLRSFIDKLLLMDFWAVAAHARLSVGYRLSFDDGPDLRICFKLIHPSRAYH